MSAQPGDVIGLPPEPLVGSRLRLAGLEDISTEVEHLDVVRRPEGWYYVGFLNKEGEPTNDKWENPIEPWDWGYVITTHKRLTYIVIGDGTWHWPISPA